MRTVLIVGATGILRPAAEALRRAGGTVLGVSRGGSEGSIGVDARDARSMSACLEGRRWDDAIVYAAAVSRDSLALIRDLTPGRCVLVRTSADADPGLGILVVPHDTLQLGWTRDDPPRWHTAEEVSGAALDVLADGAGRTLGVVRPWSDKP